jgi:hypothetical protein
MQRPEVLSYPHASAHRRKRPPAADLPVPTFSRTEWLAVLGIVLILIAIVVPVVMKVRTSAVRAAEEYERRNAPVSLDDVS